MRAADLAGWLIVPFGLGAIVCFPWPCAAPRIGGGPSKW